MRAGMSGEEYTRWWMYYARKAQRAEYQALKQQAGG